MKLTRQADRTPASIPLRRVVTVAGLGLWMGGAAPVYANPIDLFGVGARQIAMGNAYTAVADGPFAAYYNTAGVTQSKRTTVALGLQLGHMQFGSVSLGPEERGVGCSEEFHYNQGGIPTKQRKRYGYEEPHGMTVGVSMPVLHRLHFGLATYLPLDVRYTDGKVSGAGARLMRLSTIDPYIPDYVLYQNRPQRISIYMGFGYEVIDGLSLGIGTSALAAATMALDLKTTVYLSEDGTDSDGNTITSVVTDLNPVIVADVAPQSTPLAGILWDVGRQVPALQGWQVGATYRGALGLSADIVLDADVGINVELGEEENFTYGMEIEGIRMSLVDQYTPQQAALGVTALFADRFRVAADVTWNDWSSFIPAVANVPEDLDLGLGVSVDLENSREVDVTTIRDVFTPRLGLEARLGPFLTTTRLRGADVYIRAGGAFEQNPFGLQTGLTNLLNSDRVIGTGGVGMTSRNPLVKNRDVPIALDLAFQYHYLIPTTHSKDIEVGANPPDGYPVNKSYESRGSVLQGALTMSFGF